MNYVKQFANYLKIDRNLADNSINGYLSDIKQLLDYTSEDVTSISTDQIREFYASLIKEGRKRTSLNRMVISLKSFFDYLVGKGVIHSSPFDLKTTKTDKSLPKSISESDVQSILLAARNSIRDRVIAELLYASGGRVTEIVSLTVEDVDFEDSFISLFGKGRKERNNPVHESCVALIKQYIDAYGIKSGYLFPHKTDPSRHMTREAVGKLVKRLAKDAGVDPNKVSPHVFRHSFATHLLDNGCDMSHVQELLGHEDIATTRIYARITKNNKKNNYMKFHPLAQSSVL